MMGSYDDMQTRRMRIYLLAFATFNIFYVVGLTAIGFIITQSYYVLTELLGLIVTVVIYWHVLPMREKTYQRKEEE